MNSIVYNSLANFSEVLFSWQLKWYFARCKLSFAPNDFSHDELLSVFLLDLETSFLAFYYSGNCDWNGLQTLYATGFLTPMLLKTECMCTLVIDNLRSISETWFWIIVLIKEI